MYEKQEKELAQLETELERLRTEFEQYFMGLERVPPISHKDRLQRTIRTSDFRKIHNTELRFRFSTITQKFSSYCTYWDRTMRMIEEGTFKRDRFKSPNASHPVVARRMRRVVGEAAAPAARPSPAGAPQPAAAAAAAAAAAPARPPRARPSAEPRPGFEERLQPLYDAFVKARVANGESVRGLSYDGFKKSVMKTRASQMARFQCDDLDYKVKTREGKVSLVAQPVRGSDDS